MELIFGRDQERSRPSVEQSIDSVGPSIVYDQLSNDEQLNEVLRRPLFSSTRRPPDKPTTDFDLTGFRLTAIVIEPQKRIAVFADTGGKVVELREGDPLNGARIEAIASDAVSLSGLDGITTIQPKMDRKPVPAIAPAANASIAPAATAPIAPTATAPIAPAAIVPANTAAAGSSRIPRRR